MIISIISATLAGVVAGVIAFVVQKKDAITNHYVDTGVNIFVTIIALLVVFLIGSMISLPLHFKRAETEKTVVKTVDIYSLEGNKSVYGSFVLGTGTVETDFIYIFYTQAEGEQFGTYTMDYVSTKNCKIVEKDNVIPNIKYYKYSVIKGNWWTGWGDLVPKSVPEGEVVITVPTGTITRSYDVHFGG